VLVGPTFQDAHFSMSVETHAKVLDVNHSTKEMKKMLEDIKRRTPYIVSLLTFKFRLR